MTVDVQIRPLRPEHADIAATIHAEGQEGTFLTSLGHDFLRLLYAELAVSPAAFAWEAVVDGQVVGVTGGTIDTATLFRSFVRRRWPALIWVVGRRLLTHPQLFGRLWETLRYPSQLHSKPGEGEALVLGVLVPYRHYGIGSLLMKTMLQGARERGLRGLWYTVDATNERALRFHQGHGARYQREEMLYGRKMLLFYNPLHADEGEC